METQGDPYKKTGKKTHKRVPLQKVGKKNHKGGTIKLKAKPCRIYKILYLEVYLDCVWVSV